MPVSSAGILKMSRPVAASVSTSTANTGSSRAVITATMMASTSTNRMNGQTMNETSASLKIGTSTSTSAMIGKRWPGQVWWAAPRRRLKIVGSSEWKIAKIK